MPASADLTIEDLRVIRDSLNFSVQRVSDYQHMEYDHKRESLSPIESAREKVRQLIEKRKDSSHGR